MTDRPAPAPPRIWLVLGDKAGDNAQVQIVADALGWPYEVRELSFHEPYVLGKPRFRVSLYHVDRSRSAALEPPWPDLILTVGRRPSMAALWIQEQAGGAPRLVVIGRPKRWLERFDLVIAPPQFRLPQRANVLSLDLPLMRVDAAAVASAADAWRDRLSDLARPLTALFVGGPTKPYAFDPETATRLLRDVHGSAAQSGGGLYVTTSRRTPPAVIAALEAGLPAGARLYRWDRGGDNPYWALLGSADRFVVTGDSISMMVEVARLGRPLAIYPLPRKPGFRPRNHLGVWLAGAGTRAAPLEPAIDLLYRLRIAKYSRDLTEIHRRLFARGLAVPFGAPFAPARSQPADDLSTAAERIRALMAT